MYFLNLYLHAKSITELYFVSMQTLAVADPNIFNFHSDSTNREWKKNNELEFQISFDDISRHGWKNTKHQLVYISKRFLNAFQEM